MTFLTKKQQEILKKEMEVWHKIAEDEDFIAKMDYALSKFYGFDQPIYKTEEEAMRACDNMNR